jgi:hypothetical protein
VPEEWGDTKRNPETKSAPDTRSIPGTIKRMTIPAPTPDDPAVALVEIASEVDAELPAFTLAGEKTHAAPAGSPEHENPTCRLKPFTGVIVSGVLAVPPATTESDEAPGAVRMKLGSVDNVT